MKLQRRSTAFLIVRDEVMAEWAGLFFFFLWSHACVSLVCKCRLNDTDLLYILLLLDQIKPMYCEHCHIWIIWWSSLRLCVFSHQWQNAFLSFWDVKTKCQPPAPPLHCTPLRPPPTWSRWSEEHMVRGRMQMAKPHPVHSAHQTYLQTQH